MLPNLRMKLTASRSPFSRRSLHRSGARRWRSTRSTLATPPPTVPGGTLSDIVALRIYVVHLAENVEAVGSALKAVFTTNPPASTWIGVSALAVPEFLIEVEATAVLE